MASAFRRHRGDLVAQLDQTERALVVGLMEQTREILAPRQLAGGPGAGADDLDPFEALVASLREPVGLSDQPLDPALERLLPLGHRGDETVAAEFRRLTEQDLREHKSRCLDEAMALLRGSRGDKVRVPVAQGQSVLVALNDVRLLLGERLGLRTDEDAEHLEAYLAAADEDDPAAYVLAVYDFLGWLQDSLVEALLPR
jgi:hypothetical protein